MTRAKSFQLTDTKLCASAQYACSVVLTLKQRLLNGMGVVWASINNGVCTQQVPAGPKICKVNFDIMVAFSRILIING